MSCVTTAQYSVLINGSSRGFFKGKMGIRQGDSLSPYLFVLVMEGLSRLLNQAEQHSEFSFHHRYEDQKPNHLMFADDLMLVSKANRSSLFWCKQQLEIFSKASGLHINQDKGLILFSGVDTETQSNLASEMGFTIGSLPVKYLGVPLISSRLLNEDCSIIIEKVKGRISSWTNRFLSFAGRVQLINSVIVNIQMYWCNIFILPQQTIDTIEKMCRNFLWSGKWDEEGTPMVA